MDILRSRGTSFNRFSTSSSHFSRWLDSRMLNLSRPPPDILPLPFPFRSFPNSIFDRVSNFTRTKSLETNCFFFSRKEFSGFSDHCQGESGMVAKPPIASSSECMGSVYIFGSRDSCVKSPEKRTPPVAPFT